MAKKDSASVPDSIGSMDTPKKRGKKPGPPRGVVSIPEHLIELVDKKAQEMSEAFGGVQVSRSMVVGAALTSFFKKEPPGV